MSTCLDSAPDPSRMPAWAQPLPYPPTPCLAWQLHWHPEPAWSKLRIEVSLKRKVSFGDRAAAELGTRANVCQPGWGLCHESTCREAPTGPGSICPEEQGKHGAGSDTKNATLVQTGATSGDRDTHSQCRQRLHSQCRQGLHSPCGLRNCTSVLPGLPEKPVEH